MSADTRDRLRALIVQYPGLHQRELARQLGVSVALVQYHLGPLQEAGVVRTETLDGKQRIFPARQGDNVEQIACLRDPHRLHICLQLLESGPMSHQQICVATGLGKSTVSFHLKRLEKAKLATRSGEIALADPVATRALIERYGPTNDVVEKFAKLWGDLYG